MPGVIKKFPEQIHHIQFYTSSLPKAKLQHKLIQVLMEFNQKALSFEALGSRGMPDCTVIFMWGIADVDRFHYLNMEEARKVDGTVEETPLQMADFCCVIRYYKNTKPKKTPLKFDYYLLRVGFGEHSQVEFQVHHERGPRYTSPEELVMYLVEAMNKSSGRKILKTQEPS
jgi:hypothetical protein